MSETLSWVLYLGGYALAVYCAIRLARGNKTVRNLPIEREVVPLHDRSLDDGVSTERKAAPIYVTRSRMPPSSFLGRGARGEIRCKPRRNAR